MLRANIVPAGNAYGVGTLDTYSDMVNRRSAHMLNILGAAAKTDRTERARMPQAAYVRPESHAMPGHRSEPTDHWG